MPSTAARPVTEFMNDPIGFFGQSYTRMHSIGRDELEGLQREAMGIRFREHYGSIEMLRKLADRLGIKEVTIAMPQDAIEPIRRMCKWIVDEECDPATVVPLWELAR